MDLAASTLVTTLEPEIFRRSGVVENAIGAFQPDVVIGASSTVPALRAVEAAGELPERYEPLLVTREPTVLAEVISEEVLLALPIVPMHDEQTDCHVFQVNH